MPREIDPQTNSFFTQGYDDGALGQPKCAPDECKRLHEFSDYYAGWDAGRDDMRWEARAKLLRPLYKTGKYVAP
jgi:hypothetical protein